MVKKSKNLVSSEAQLLEKVKRLGVQAMFSDDTLLDELVLKGGNAMALVHRLSARASVDLDFSISHDFPDGIEVVQARIEKALTITFRENGFEVFDLKMTENPKAISPDMADFWGGYGVEFKLITANLFKLHSADIESLRKHALSIGQGKRFLIDISRFEYTLDKQQFDFDGYRIYVYSPEMIVCEKLRAICQQMPEYGPIIKRSRAGSARARDFIDIHVLVDTLKLDLTSEKNQEMLVRMFELKKVPLFFLGRLSEHSDYHRADFPAVQATMVAGANVRDFDFYFNFTQDLVNSLKPLWDKETPSLDVALFSHPIR